MKPYPNAETAGSTEWRAVFNHNTRVLIEMVQNSTRPEAVKNQALVYLLESLA
jgi:hypothetical protein